MPMCGGVEIVLIHHVKHRAKHGYLYQECNTFKFLYGHNILKFQLQEEWMGSSESSGNQKNQDEVLEKTELKMRLGVRESEELEVTLGFLNFIIQKQAS